MINESDKIKGVVIVGSGRHSKLHNYIRHVERLQNIVIMDDIEEESRLEELRKDFPKWLEMYFPQYVKGINTQTHSVKPDRQRIKLGVRKRYMKAPSIKMVSPEEYFKFHFQLTNKTMRQKTIKRPTLKAESIFDEEKRLQKEAREISKTFVHTKPVKFLLK